MTRRASFRASSRVGGRDPSRGRRARRALPLLDPPLVRRRWVDFCRVTGCRCPH